tara:strand:+ start:883 stop:1341 length:459 start_codon:yes stop_codon:yes gene_type:complete
MAEDLRKLEELIDLMDARGVEELEVELKDTRVRLRKSHNKQPAPASIPVPQEDQNVENRAVDGRVSAEKEDDGLAFIKSPIVGTFYSAPEPGADPFVKVGTRVKKGQVLCIVEAMKLMNEIDSDQDGEVVEVLVENNQAIQYGQALFSIKPL